MLMTKLQSSFQNTLNHLTSQRQYEIKLHLLLFLQVVMILLLIAEPIFIWLAAIAVILYISKYHRLTQNKKAPPPYVEQTLALFITILIAYQGLSAGMLASMVNLLIAGTVLKSVFSRKKSDYSQVVLLNTFLISVGFIYQQTLVFFILCLLPIIVSLTLFGVISNQLTSISQIAKQSIKMLMLSIPLTVMLFLILPRLPSLWLLPLPNQATVGLSESLSPGDISKLTQSSDLAFRASFNTNTPPQHELYWRMMVQEDFDGTTWEINSLRKQSTRPNYRTFPEDQADYQITFEPSFSYYLPSIDSSTSDKITISSTDARMLKSANKVANQMMFRAKYWPEHPKKTRITDYERYVNLRVPKDINPNTRQLISTLRANAQTEIEFVNDVLNYFNQEPFEYTLTPPLLRPFGSNQVDGFLETQSGFCSHYASAFTFMMRIAGIPARIVSGYQGGEYYEEQNYLNIYQFNAHAWTEVWIEDEGWTRFDPTAMVAPERINLGLEEALSGDLSFFSQQRFSLFKYKNIKAVNWIRLQLSNLDYFWSSWVLSFDNKMQTNLLEYLFNNKDMLARLLFLVIGMVILIPIWLYFVTRENNREQSQSEFLFHHFLKTVKMLNIEYDKGMTPIQYIDLLAKQHPTMKSELNTIKGLFCLFMYKKIEQNRTDYLTLKRKIRDLKKSVNQEVKNSPI